jgi:thymidylate synthase
MDNLVDNLTKDSLYKNQWLNIYKDLHFRGNKYSPRGMKTLEIENYQFTGDPRFKICNFRERKISLKYLVKELLWYLSGDRNNESIVEASKFWETIKNKEKPFWNSNYGYNIFAQHQFEYCYNQLIEDKDTRQAVIIINSSNVMMSDTKDKICTYAISFRIRDNKLNMSVSMRSNDFIIGTQIDYFQFSIIQEMLFTLLKSIHYPDLKLGTYTHKADSFHIYERNFKQMADIITSNGASFTPVYTPKMERNEVKLLMKGVLDKQYAFSAWCLKQLEK